MLTTQIGSLPFYDITTAIDYAIQFDLPFIPTLPQLNTSEMMVSLALDGYLKMDFTVKEKCFLPMLQKHRPKRCKYQILGPISAMLIQKDQLDSQKLREYLVQKLLVVKNIFIKFDCEPIIFIDEPCLEFASKKYNDLLIQTLDELSEHFNSIGIHCCSNADWLFLNELPVQYLSFDYFRYQLTIDKILDRLQNKILCFGIYPTSQLIKSEELLKFDNTFDNIIEELSKMNLSSHYITPSCGLGISSLEETQKALNLKKLLIKKILK